MRLKSLTFEYYFSILKILFCAGLISVTFPLRKASGQELFMRTTIGWHDESVSLWTYLYTGCDVGFGPEWCILDTGGRGALLPGGDARYDAFKVVGARELPNAYGVDVCDIVPIESVKLGGRDLGMMTFYRCTNAQKFVHTNVLLGLPAIEGEEVTFDFESKALVYGKTTHTPSAAFSRKEKEWIILPGKIGELPINFKIDTGASHTMIDRRLVESNPVLKTALTPSTIINYPEFFDLSLPIEVAGVELGPDIVIVQDLSSLSPTKPVVFLGLRSMLKVRRWHFDLKNNLFSIDK